jgi:ArsR family transcriptional regulator
LIEKTSEASPRLPGAPGFSVNNQKSASTISYIDNRQWSVYFYPMTNAEQTLTNSLNAIVDPTRRRILHSLKQRGATSLGKSAGLCAGDIEERVRLSQPTISHHMAILTKAGLVEAKKQGQWRWYRRNEPAIRRLVKMLRAEL